MDVIFGMDWMLTFGANINCLTKSVTFSKPVEDVRGKLLTAEQVKKSLDGEASVFMMFASLKKSDEKGVGDLPIVQEFPEVFPDDIISTYVTPRFPKQHNNDNIIRVNINGVLHMLFKIYLNRI